MTTQSAITEGDEEGCNAAKITLSDGTKTTWGALGNDADTTGATYASNRAVAPSRAPSPPNRAFLSHIG